MKPAQHLMPTARGRRHGIVLPSVAVPSTPADIPGLVNVAVPSLADSEAAPASGGIAADFEEAQLAATGEALERYAGSLVPLPLREPSQISSGDSVLGLEDFGLYSPEQISHPAFAHKDLYASTPPLTDVYDIRTNERTWVPAAVVSLDRRLGSVTTSSGLAAHPLLFQALLRATQEIVERDALMSTWLHEVHGRQVPMSEALIDPVVDRGGSVVAVDATPAYSPHPVALVLGGVPRRGRMRYSLGAACRATWRDAVEKAYMEWAQGITFVGDRLMRSPELSLDNPEDVRDFDDHALYYSANPSKWSELPVLRGGSAPPPVDAVGAEGTPVSQLEELITAVSSAGFRLFYRDVTTIDLQQIGIRAVKVMSPDLIPVHHDHRFPHTGGTALQVERRYPWWEATGRFPSPYPHPLG